jgi:hypothetical protein
MKKYRFVTVIMLLACLPAGGAAVHHHDGKVITGTIIEISDSFVVLETQ